VKQKSAPLITKDLFFDCIKQSFFMMSPKVQWTNPVMFVTYIGAIVVTIHTLVHAANASLDYFHLQIALWLWFTILFANFSQALAESRGKAQAGSLRKSQDHAYARLVSDGSVQKMVPATQLKKGDIVLVEAGETIPADGDVIEGVATVDESAITGESAPVIRESGGDRSAVTAGTKVVSDQLKVKVTCEAGNSFLDQMIGLIEGAKRQKTPNEVALHIVLCGITLMFLVVVATLVVYIRYSQGMSPITGHVDSSVPVMTALLVCLIPTTIGALINAVGIAGMDRLIQCNVIAKSGRSIEAAGDINVLILDKTGTITMGNRMASAFIPATGVNEQDFAAIAQEASLSDETPEGRSIVVLAKKLFDLRAKSLDVKEVTIVPFSASTRMSGIDFRDSSGKITRQIRKGAADAIKGHVEALGGLYTPQIEGIVHSISRVGGTPLLVSDNQRIIGVIHLKDIIKGGLKERFQQLRKMGIRTIMITGDNPLTAASIAAEAGVDDFIAEATPEIKLALIRKEQEGGRLVAMTGDGTNDAPALAQADVAVAMNTGTQASREAGNMIDLDSNPTKIIDIVEIGKQLLMTRGALTTFSIANDLAKYFAIIPAILGGLYLAKEGADGPLSMLNIMRLYSHKSAILSAVIFNALVIIALIPLAMRGVNYEAQPANVLLRNNVLIYGLGGIIVPFIGIKIIDVLIVAFGVV
jgi:K+-transporting ATPase ATPase B chain